MTLVIFLLLLSSFHYWTTTHKILLLCDFPFPSSDNRMTTTLCAVFSIALYLFYNTIFKDNVLPSYCMITTQYGAKFRDILFWYIPQYSKKSQLHLNSWLIKKSGILKKSKGNMKVIVLWNLSNFNSVNRFLSSLITTSFLA